MYNHLNKRRISGWLGIGIWILLWSGCTSLRLGNQVTVVPSSWLTEGGTPERSRLQMDGDLKPPLKEIWTYNAGAGFSSGSPLISDGIVFVSTRKGEVFALDLYKGDKIAAEEFSQSIEGAPALSERMIYVPAAWGSKVLKAYDLINGGVQWSIKGAPIESPLLLLERHLIAADVEGNVLALDPDHGVERWRYSNTELDSYIAGPVRLASGDVMVVDISGHIVALSPVTGDVKWEKHLDENVYATPAVSEQSLYIPTTTGKFYALDQTGREQWVYEVEDPLTRFSSPAITKDRIVFGGSDGILRGVDARTGTTLWTFQTDGNFSAPPAIVSGIVYAGAMDRALYAIDISSGSVLWQTTLRGRIKSAPAVFDDHLIVLAEPRHVYAFTPE